MIVDEVMADNGWTDDFFKTQIKPICDAAIIELNILGVDTICDSNEYSFEDYIAEPNVRALARNYVDLYVRLQFDPPQNSRQIEMLESSIKRLQSRIKDVCDLKLI